MWARKELSESSTYLIADISFLVGGLTCQKQRLPRKRWRKKAELFRRNGHT
jgi:hypothetical protein